MPESQRQQDDARTLRIMIFPDRPDCILFYVPDGMLLAIPPLPSLFYKPSTTAILGEAGVRYRITESVPGRWTSSIMMMKKSERAERAQRQRQHEATIAALDRSGTALAQSRAEAIAKKHAIDDQIRETQAWIREAKSRAFTRGEYEDPKRFRQKERDLAQLKQESQGLQTRLGELRKQEKLENIAAHNEVVGRFKAAAMRVLTAEQLDAVFDAMDLEDDREPT